MKIHQIHFVNKNKHSISMKWYVLIFLLAFSCRCLFFFLGPWQELDRSLMPDSGRYLILAENLIKFHTYGQKSENGLMTAAFERLRLLSGTLPQPDENGLRPESYRVPGYPLFIMLVRMIFNNPLVVLMIQCILGAFLSCLVMSIAKSLTISTKGSVVIGLIWALHPALIIYDLFIMTENLFNVFVFLSLYKLARARDWLSFLLSGFFLGFASLVRPFLGLLFLPLAAGIWLYKAKRQFLILMVFVVGAILPMTVWSLRNYAVGEGWRLTTANDLLLYYFVACYVISEDRKEDWLESWPNRINELTEKLKENMVQDEDLCHKMRQLAYSEILAKPVATTKVIIKSMLKLLIGHSVGETAKLVGISYEPSGLFAKFILRERNTIRPIKPIVLTVALGWMFLNFSIFLAACWGVWKSFRQRMWKLAIMNGLTTVLLLISTSFIAAGVERYRIAMMLPLLIFVGNIFSGKQNSRELEHVKVSYFQDF